LERKGLGFYFISLFKFEDENEEMRRIFGSKRDETTGLWKK
jgi:hypothetical protein